MPARTGARRERPRSGQRRFDSHTSSIAATRRFARSLASTYVGDAVRLGDIELATSELVTNAIEHGDAEPVVVRVEGGPAEVVVSVTSSVAAAKPSVLVGSTSDPEAASDAVASHSPPEFSRGRGLAIARAVSDVIEITASEDTLTVACTFRVGEPQV